MNSLFHNSDGGGGEGGGGGGCQTAASVAASPEDGGAAGVRWSLNTPVFRYFTIGIHHQEIQETDSGENGAKVLACYEGLITEERRNFTLKKNETKNKTLSKGRLCTVSPRTHSCVTVMSP